MDRNEIGNQGQLFLCSYFLFTGMSGPDLSLCTFVWEAAPSDPHSKSIYHIGIFDINRWYHAQMPFSIRYDWSILLGP